MKQDEIRAIERVFRGREVRGADYLFCSERGAKLTRNGFWRVVSEAGNGRGYRSTPIHTSSDTPAVYYLANRGCDLRLIHEYLGHKQIQNTVRYTTLSAERFRGLW